MKWNEKDRAALIKQCGGITRPIAERGKPMPDQSHLYIDCTDEENPLGAATDAFIKHELGKRGGCHNEME